MRNIKWLGMVGLLLSSGAWAAEQTMVFEISRWVMEQQRDFHRELARLVQMLAREENPALLGSLMVASFLYGVFHAAGPGHGKAVIASYLLATKAPLRKGIQLSFLSALAQGVVAITLVWSLAQVLDLASQITETTRVLEIASYVAIGLIGAWMLWRIARGKSSCGHDHSRDHVHEHPHGHACTGHHHGHGHSCSHDHHHESLPGHAEKALDDSSQEVTTAKRSTIAMVSAIGIRPCTGAVLVLLFATSTGIFQWGMLATLVMSLGTGITVSALALLSVLVRDGSFALSPSAWRRRVTQALGVVAACALIFISVTMIYSDLQVAGRAF
ncbi:nickel/cobalt transporter [Marinomonas aquimarina]|uniref:nickel/cobalt transporter n=1 Tax=Marinomonas aquimarina TaxID=295068 RepID=UPI0012E8E203|nr:nickel/cobalt transporter [Marinomonas aquimarina]